MVPGGAKAGCFAAAPPSREGGVSGADAVVVAAAAVAEEDEEEGGKVGELAVAERARRIRRDRAASLMAKTNALPQRL